MLPTGIAQTALTSEEFRGKLELLAQPLAVEPAYLSFNQASSAPIRRWWRPSGRNWRACLRAAQGGSAGQGSRCALSWADQG